jgi:hypothetical protein
VNSVFDQVRDLNVFSCVPAHGQWQDHQSSLLGWVSGLGTGTVQVRIDDKSVELRRMDGHDRAMGESGNGFQAVDDGEHITLAFRGAGLTDPQQTGASARST